MIKIGVTGLIGSGKSTIMNILGGLNVPLYFTDIRAKEIMQSELRDEIVDLFGQQAFAQGRLDRSYIASSIFADRQLRSKLEALVHPQVEADIVRWFETQSDEPFAAVESAILVESGLIRFVDEVVVVSAPQDIRVERVMRRDGCSARQVLDRINAQMDHSQIESYASWVVSADEKELLIPQVVEFLSKKKINFAPRPM